MSADHDRPEEHDLGLGHDLPTLLNRRRALGLLSGAGLAAALAACGGSDETASSSRTSGARPSGGGGAASSVDVAEGEVPEETGGPFPADGTNGVNVLTESGIVRSDITSSFGEASGVAKGVATTIALTILNMNDGDVKPYEGAAIYIWHCDAQGRYSMYDQGAANENYLRGVQVADEQGKVEFRSIFPGAYAGRWPHIHFEVYPSQKAAVSASDKLADVADRPPGERRADGVRTVGLRREQRQPRADLAEERHGVLRRLLAADGEGLWLRR